MYRFIVYLISILTLAGCAVQQPLSAFPSTELDLFPERVELTVPGAPVTLWKSGVTTRKDLSHFTTEAVPVDQTLDNWSDIVVIDYWSHLQNHKSIDSLAREYRQSISETCPSLGYVTIERDSNSLLYEWSVKDCDGVDGQFETGRFQKTENGIHRVIYDHKGNALSDQEKEQWRTTLRTMVVRDIRPPSGSLPIAMNQGYVPHWKRQAVKIPVAGSSANPNWIMNNRTRGLGKN